MKKQGLSFKWLMLLVTATCFFQGHALSSEKNQEAIVLTESAEIFNILGRMPELTNSIQALGLAYGFQPYVAQMEVHFLSVSSDPEFDECLVTYTAVLGQLTSHGPAELPDLVPGSVSVNDELEGRCIDVAEDILK